jgi:hypothetical protein
MTKLSDKQYDMLTRIEHLYARRRAVRSEVMKEVDALIASRTNRINDELFEVVRDAVNAGVPRSRIGAAIGTSANITWTKLINEAFADAEKTDEDSEVDYGSDEPNVEIRKVDKAGTIVDVYLDNYLLNGDVVSGEVTFAWSDTAEEWFVQGDEPLGFVVERALFGAETDEALRAEWDRAVA